MIVDNDKVDNGTSLVGIKYKMILNLYNYNCLRSDTFTISQNIIL